MVLSAKEVETLYAASNGATMDYVFQEGSELRCKYPDPSELPGKIPTAKRNRQIYNEFNTGATKEELAVKYGFKRPASIGAIIRDIRERDKLYGGTEWYDKASYRI